MTIELKRGVWHPRIPLKRLFPIMVFLAFATLALVGVQSANSLQCELTEVHAELNLFAAQRGRMQVSSLHSASPKLQRPSPRALGWPIGLELPLGAIDGIPDDSDLLPGAPRPYRQGVHQGVDFFAPPFTKVEAVAEGRVLLATPNYREPTRSFRDLLLQECATSGQTPTGILFALYGRFVVLAHDQDGRRFLTLYAHLAPTGDLKRQGLPDIALGLGDRVSRGECLGYVLNSGTSSYGSLAGCHLHFELHLGGWGNYLGKDQPVEQTRHLLSKAFALPARQQTAFR